MLIQYTLLWLLVNGGIGGAIGKSKGLVVDGIIYGCLLGPIGWIIVLLKQPSIEAEIERERRKEELRNNR